MLLYHGTKASVALASLKEGLKPRAMTKASNWDHSVSSNKNCVYLTDTYPLYFAVAAHSTDTPGKVGIVEIDTAKLNYFDLFPDEDVLEQAGRKYDNVKGSMEQRTRWYRKHLFEYQNVWTKSIEAMGTCAHRGIIPPSAITRIALIDYKKQAALCYTALDAHISLLNYRYVANKYQNIVKFIFGTGIPEYTEFDRFTGLDKLLENRNGIEIIDNVGN